MALSTDQYHGMIQGVAGGQLPDVRSHPAVVMILVDRAPGNKDQHGTSHQCRRAREHAPPVARGGVLRPALQLLDAPGREREAWNDDEVPVSGPEVGTTTEVVEAVDSRDCRDRDHHEPVRARASSQREPEKHCHQ